MSVSTRDVSRAVCDGMESCVFADREDECVPTFGERVLIRSYDRPFVLASPCDQARMRVYDPQTPGATSIWNMTHESGFSNETCAPDIPPRPGAMVVIDDSFGVYRPIPVHTTFFDRVSVRGTWLKTHMLVYTELLRRDPCCAFPSVFLGLNNATCVMTARESTCGIADAAEYACIVTHPTLRTQVNLTHAEFVFGVIPIDESCGLMTNGNRLTDAFGASVVVYNPSLEWFSMQAKGPLLTYADFVVVLSVCIPVVLALILRCINATRSTLLRGIVTTQSKLDVDRRYRVRKRGVQVVPKGKDHVG